MNNVVFRKILKPAGYTREGEFPITVEVTEENNGYCVFLCGHPEKGTLLLRHDLYDKMALIEWAVTEASQHGNVKAALAMANELVEEKPPF